MSAVAVHLLARGFGRFDLDARTLCPRPANSSGGKRYVRRELDSRLRAQSPGDLAGEIRRLRILGADARASIAEVDADRLVAAVGGDHVVQHRIAPAPVVGCARSDRRGGEQGSRRAAQPEPGSDRVLLGRLPPLTIDAAREGLMRRRRQHDRDQGDRDNDESDQRQKTRFDIRERCEDIHRGRTELQAQAKAPQTDIRCLTPLRPIVPRTLPELDSQNRPAICDE